MPLPTLSWDAWYTAPGVFPAFLGSMIMLTALMLFGKAIRLLRGHRIMDFTSMGTVIKSTATARWAIALGLLIVYVFGLFGVVHYIAATFIYLLANMIVFDKKKRTLRRTLFHMLIAVVVAVAVAYLFEDFAKIPLP
jgi:hypothetical protein